MGESKSAKSRGNILVDVKMKRMRPVRGACPQECLELLPELNAYGVHPAHYTGEGSPADLLLQPVPLPLPAGAAVKTARAAGNPVTTSKPSGRL